MLNLKIGGLTLTNPELKYLEQATDVMIRTYKKNYTAVNLEEYFNDSYNTNYMDIYMQSMCSNSNTLIAIWCGMIAMGESSRQS